MADAWGESTDTLHAKRDIRLELRYQDCVQQCTFEEAQWKCVEGSTVQAQQFVEEFTTDWLEGGDMFCVDEGEWQCGFVDVEREQEDKFGAVQGWCIVMFNSKHAELQQWVQDCQVVFVMWVQNQHRTLLQVKDRKSVV